MVQSTATVIAVGLLLFSTTAHAGSRTFQPAIGHYIDTISLDAGNSTDFLQGSDIKKRALTFDPNSGLASTPALWPNGVVEYCWDPAKGDLAYVLFGQTNFIRDAVAKWTAAGLPEQSFGFKKAADCSAANRANYLLISQGNYLSTTVGKQGSGFDAGPRMILSTDATLGHQNVVANVAHEMGHSWGLYHEHQNRYFWDAAYAQGGGNIFGTAANPFHCENLKDYATIRNRVKETRANNDDAEADRLMREEYCKSRVKAEEVQFSALDYLPMIAEATITPAGNGFDLKSIMLYPTGAGGTVQNGVRAPILGDQSGNPIPPNLNPSERDVAGLKRLYGIKETSKFNPLGAAGNPKKASFDQVRRKDRDSTCNTQ